MNEQSKIQLSVIIAACNEQDNIQPLLNRLKPHLDQLHLTYEIIFVDDGSKDSTWKNILTCSQDDSHIKGVALSRNFGHQHALLCGLAFSSGAAIICMDADLQHPPEIIAEMLAAWQKGAKIVTTTRMNHRSTSIIKRWTSKYFYKLFSWLSGVPLSEGTSDFCLLDRTVLEIVLRFKDVNLFLRGAIRWTGFPGANIPYKEEKRFSGKTKYSFVRMLKFALSAVVSFSTTPLKLGIWVGLLTSLASFAELVYILIKYLQGVTVPGWASTLGILSFLFGMLFILLGCLGLYLANIHEVLKDRPRYIVRERMNI